MKKMLLSMFIGCFTVSLHAQFSKASLQATGLTCAMCSNAVNKALQKVPFIESVKADIKNSAFNIVFKEGQEVDIDALKEAVEDAGFSVGSLKLTCNVGEVKLEKDKHIRIGNENFHFLNGDGRSLNGEQVITVVDKNFVTEKQFKKLSAATKLSCMQTGKTSSCCEKDGMAEGERVYHVTI
ncbi:MAG TPA: heavy-metal-associated domain-containing protein [Chitinophagaceae bacterium]|nr:heavy-metal-associated domain-containing protein [Chitinophagaceae bacterium]